MVAEEVVFNSDYNKESFLDSISHHLKLIPDHQPKHLAEQIRPKCRVLYFPINCFDEVDDTKEPLDDKNQNAFHPSTFLNKTRDRHSYVDNPGSTLVSSESEMSQGRAKSEKISRVSQSSIESSNFEGQNSSEFQNKHCSDDTKEEERTANILHVDQTISQQADPVLHIVWPHRWEHDKGPEAFFESLFELQANGHDFKVSVIGESFSQVPDIFQVAYSRLGERILAWGYQSREDFIKILKSAHVAVSTADHEFFGVSMLEATYYGCFPLCPKRLVYPEIYPGECLYSTQAQLVKRLKQFCRRPDKIKTPLHKKNMMQYSWDSLKEDFRGLLMRRT